MPALDRRDQLAQVGLHALDRDARAVEQVVERVLVGLGHPQRVDGEPAAALDAPADAHAQAGGDVGARRGLERPRAVPEDELARLGGTDHQHLVDLLPGGELSDAHDGKP